MDEYQSIAVEQLEVSPNNPRKHFTQESLQELAESLATVGLIEPLVVRELPPDGGATGYRKYQIVCGERRYRAGLIAKMPSMHCHVRDLSDDQVFEIQITENLQREDINPLDESEAFHTLMSKKKYTMEDIATRFGKSQDYVFGRLRLSALIDAAKKRLEDEVLPVTAAIKLAALNEKQQTEALKRLVVPVKIGGKDRELFTGLRDMKSYFDNHVLMGLSQADFNTKDEKLIPACGSCTVCPKRTGNSLFGDIAEADKCTDAICYHNKHVTHYLNLQAELTKKLGIKVGFAARHYNTEKSYKDLGQVTSLYDWEKITDKQAKTEKNASYAVFVGIDSTDTEKDPAHGWIKIRQKAVDKIKKSPQEKQNDDKRLEIQAMATRLYRAFIFDKFKQAKKSPVNDSLAYAGAYLMVNVQHFPPIADIVKSYDLSLKLQVEAESWKEIVLTGKTDVKEIRNFNTDLSNCLECLKQKSQADLLKIINELTFLARLEDDEIKLYELDEKSIMKEATAQAKALIEKPAPADKDKKAKKAKK